MRQKRLSVVDRMEDAVRGSGIIFLCVGTPSKPDGSMDVGPLHDAAKYVATAWRDEKTRTVVVKSTGLPGPAVSVERPLLPAAVFPFPIAGGPAVLRACRGPGHALRPDRIIPGVDSPG